MKMFKNQNFWHLILLNPWFKILFFIIPDVSLSLLYWPLTSCKISEKTNEQFPRYSKMDGRSNDGPQTNEGDYYGPNRVNPGSKKLQFLYPKYRKFNNLWRQNDITTNSSNLVWQNSRYNVDYFTLGEFHWNILTFKVSKGVRQFCPPPWFI